MKGEFLLSEPMRSTVQWLRCSVAWALLTSLALSVGGREALPFGKPIARPIKQSGLTVEIELVVELPPTSEDSPLTRINAMTAPRDGSDRLFVNDLRGKIYDVSGQTPTLYMDYASFVPELYHESGIGSGLGSIAFHPQFGRNGKFYTSHVEQLSPSEVREDLPLERKKGWTYGVILEWTTTNPKGSRFEGTFREVLRVGLPTAFHGLQHIAFNPNSEPGDSDHGMLYICLGEGGALQRGEALDRLRKLSSPLGCILRIDPTGSGGAMGDYGIPADNPWAGHEDPDVLGEIWCMGLRNPHRLSWDSGGTGKMLFSEIGELRVEEVNLGLPGSDYGWPIREGTFGYDPQGEVFEVFTLSDAEKSKELGLTYPVAQYDHTEGFAISGGGVYRGERLPKLTGRYLFGDIVNGRLFYVEESKLMLGGLAQVYEFQLSLNGEPTSMLELAGGGRTDLRIGWDAEGELYFFEKPKGRVYRAVDVTRKVGD